MSAAERFSVRQACFHNPPGSDGSKSAVLCDRRTRQNLLVTWFDRREYFSVLDLRDLAVGKVSPVVLDLDFEAEMREMLDAAVERAQIQQAAEVAHRGLLAAAL